MNIDFGANKTPVEIIKERAFRGISEMNFRDICSGRSPGFANCF